jgi:hypothetical protein
MKQETSRYSEIMTHYLHITPMWKTKHVVQHTESRSLMVPLRRKTSLTVVIVDSTHVYERQNNYQTIVSILSLGFNFLLTVWHLNPVSETILISHIPTDTPVVNRYTYLASGMINSEGLAPIKQCQC